MNVTYAVYATSEVPLLRIVAVDCRSTRLGTRGGTRYEYHHHLQEYRERRSSGVPQNMSTEPRGGSSRLRPAGTIIVTRVRPAAVRTTHATVLFADLRGYTGMA